MSSTQRSATECAPSNGAPASAVALAARSRGKAATLRSSSGDRVLHGILSKTQEDGGGGVRVTNTTSTFAVATEEARGVKAKDGLDIDGTAYLVRSVSDNGPVTMLGLSR